MWLTRLVTVKLQAVAEITVAGINKECDKVEVNVSEF
jgi:hypothetical protein